MSTIEILSPGIYTSVQDLGRKGFRKFGIPTSGAMDSFSASFGNSLVGNEANTPVLEITINGPRLKFKANSICVLVGGEINARIGKVLIKNNQVFAVNRDDILELREIKTGCRSYLCIKDGFRVTSQFGSCSSSPNAQLGSTILRKGNVLHFEPHGSQFSSSNSRVKTQKSNFSSSIIDAQPGPEFHLIPKGFLHSSFTVSKDSNRMGIRLAAEKQFEHTNSILTSAVMPGTVQLPPNGHPIVLMRDAQTTGGYPRILQLTEGGINIMAQKRPRDIIRFSIQENPC